MFLPFPVLRTTEGIEAVSMLLFGLPTRRRTDALVNCVAIQGANVAAERRIDIMRHLMKWTAAVGIGKNEGIQLR